MTSQLELDLPTRDRMCSAAGHTTSGGWWLMGATLIADDLELATVLSGTHLLTSEGWKAELT